MGLLITFILGIFTLLGTFIALFIKNSKKFISFSIGMAFGVMLMLIIFDLAPEVVEIFFGKFTDILAVALIIVFSLSGIFLLKGFDVFVPDHEHDKKHDDKNLFHIGIVSSVALVLHNIIEGMAVYSVYQNNPSTSLLLCIGVGLHNIPLGMVISAMFYDHNKNKAKTIFISFLISLSTFVGGFIMLLLSSVISELFLGVLLAVTLGMIIYISFFELLTHIVKDSNKKYSLIGIFVGVLVILLSLIF